MINKIKCLFKGHKFLMNFYPNRGCYYPSNNDYCKQCNKKRNV